MQQWIDSGDKKSSCEIALQVSDSVTSSTADMGRKDTIRYTKRNSASVCGQAPEWSLEEHIINSYRWQAYISAECRARTIYTSYNRTLIISTQVSRSLCRIDPPGQANWNILLVLPMPLQHTSCGTTGNGYHNHRHRQDRYLLYRSACHAWCRMHYQRPLGSQP